MQQIQLQVSKLVVHDGFQNALSLLLKFHHLLIVGNPGIGKTTLARMLACHYVVEGFEPVFVAGDIGDAWAVIDKAILQKEQFVIIYDDFLGQLRFGDSKFQKNEEKTLLQLIDRVKRTPSLRLILTTREYILADARRMYGAFDQRADEVEKFTLKLVDYSRAQRARVLFNHLYFSDLPGERLRLLVTTKKYKDIVDHEYFSPRIVETICSVANTRSMNDREFVDYVIHEFDDPRRLWEHPFRHQISVSSQQVLGILWSFGGTASMPDLQISFHRLNASQKRETASQNFLDALKELDGNFITTDKLRITGNKYGFVLRVRFQNPSVNDFVDNVMRLEESRLQSIVEGITAFQQFSQITRLVLPTQLTQIAEFSMSRIVMSELWDAGFRTLEIRGNRFVNYSGDPKPRYEQGRNISYCRRYEVLLRLAKALDLQADQFQSIIQNVCSQDGWRRMLSLVPYDNSEASGASSLIEFVTENAAFLKVDAKSIQETYWESIKELITGDRREFIWIGDVEQLASGLGKVITLEMRTVLKSAVHHLAGIRAAECDDKDTLESESSSLRGLSKILPEDSTELLALADKVQNQAASIEEETESGPEDGDKGDRYNYVREESEIEDLFNLLAER